MGRSWRRLGDLQGEAGGQIGTAFWDAEDSIGAGQNLYSGEMRLHWQGLLEPNRSHGQKKSKLWEIFGFERRG
jgi:hypothetical protein